jgi:hypothetical protein
MKKMAKTGAGDGNEIMAKSGKKPAVIGGEEIMSAGVSKYQRNQ